MAVDLPQELVRNVFSDLKNKDLENCRLACRQWGSVALEKLRETLSFTDFNEDTAKDLIQTLEQFPSIANQVKHLDIDIQKPLDDDAPFDENYVIIYWDIEEVVKAVFKHCPNITTIFCSTNPIQEVWEIMLEAINEGYLTKLELIPVANDMDWAYTYLPVALALKSNLKKLDICNGFLGMKSVNDTIFKPEYGTFSDPWLLGFSNLEQFTFYWFGNESLLNCNTMIDNCTKNNPRLKSLNLCIKPLQDPKFPKVNSLDPITACCNIKEFNCSWQMLDGDDIIYYLIKKFPNLEHLTIELGAHVWRLEHVSNQAVYSFFKYMSDISQLDITCHVKTLQVEQCLVYLMEKKNFVEIEIVFSPRGAFEHDTLTIIRSHQKENTKVKITTTDNPDYIHSDKHHLAWLDGIGGNIKSLTITHVKKASLEDIKYNNNTIIMAEDDSGSNNWFDDVLQSCASLNHLIIATPGFIILNNKQIQNFALENLELRDLVLSYDSSYILSDLSVSLPCLQYLFLDRFIIDGSSNTVNIDMPYTSFHEFTLGKAVLKGLPEDATVVEPYFINIYLKITTEKSGAASSHFKIDQGEIVSLTGDAYNSYLMNEKALGSKNNMLDQGLILQIYCKSMTSLCIASSSLSSRKVYNLGA